MRRRRALALLVAAGTVAGLSTGCGSEPEPVAEPASRVAIVSLPGVTWEDVRGEELPNLRSVIDRSAIGTVSTRIGRTRSSTTAGYLTMGAGTRAVVPPVDLGVALNPDELHAGIPASELLRRRLGRTVDGIAYIPVGATIDANDGSPYGASPGLLGDELDRLDVGRAVIANADAAEGFPTDRPVPEGAFSRSAVAALMGSDGVVPDGSVGRSLLVEDPTAPFGRRLDPEQVLASFDEAWDDDGRTVALVEASDLSRAAAYAPRATPAQAARLRAEALADADALLGDVASRLDPETDALVVVSPVAAGGLGIAAIDAPGIDGGLLRSASTRRDGYLYLADLMPTVLDLLGEAAPEGIEGTAVQVAPASGDRVALLADHADDASTRDARLPLVVTVVIAVLAALVAATVALRRRGRPATIVRPFALGALGVVPATYLAGSVAATAGSVAAYGAFVAAVAVAFGAVATALDRWRPGIGPIVAVGAVLATFAIDVVAGSPLQVNTIFGYSMAVAGRFTGLGNLAFALFASAGVCFAVLAYERWGPTALWWVAAVLVAVVLLDGLPMFGADVGGVSALVPAFWLTVLVLAGRRIGWREVGLGLVGGLAVVAVLGVVDSSRPAAAQTHLARLGDHLVAGRFDAVATTMWRRVHASFGNDEVLVWLLALTIVGAALAQAATVARGAPWPSALVDRTSPATLALGVGLGAIATIGLVTNDSSVAVPATMLIVIVPVLVLRTTSPTAAASPSAPAAEASPVAP